MVTAGPSYVQTAGLLALAALLAAVGATGGLAIGTPGDTGLAVLALPAAVVAASLGIRDLVLRPVLTADHAGLRVVTGVRRQEATWSQVERLRVVTDRRTPLLEIDLGSSLLVLSRLRLGRAPADVLEELSALQR